MFIGPDGKVFARMSEKLLVTIKSPQRTVDVQVPDDACIGDLLPFLVEVCGLSGQFHHLAGAETAAWSLRASSAPVPFVATRTLSDYGVLDGDVLHLRESHLQPALTSVVEVPASRFEDIAPSEQTGWIGVTWRKI